MGTLTPFISTLATTVGTLSQIGNTINTVTGYEERRQKALLRAQQDQAMAALKAQQNQSMKEAQQSAAAERERLNLTAQQDDARRRAALKRAVAKQNARFGASGITGGTGGSREAVLLGMYNETDEERKQREDLDRLRFNALDTNLDNMSQRNILELSQLAERQRLQRAAQY